MPDRPCVVLDTNVLLSAILFGGSPLQVVDAWRLRGLFDLAISPEILAEILAKLADKFNLPASLVGEWRTLLSTNVKRVTPVHEVRVCRDPENDKFLATAEAAGTVFLVTSDKDLLEIELYGTTRIMTPRAFLDLLGESRWWLPK